MIILEHAGNLMFCYDGNYIDHDMREMSVAHYNKPLTPYYVGSHKYLYLFRIKKDINIKHNKVMKSDRINPCQLY